jgi:hypothetical protein
VVGGPRAKERARLSGEHGDEGRPDRGTIQEPPNATVDDWLGQQASEDEAVVDELLEETGGDVSRWYASPSADPSDRALPQRLDRTDIRTVRPLRLRET